jgi:hypothetical protein
MLYELLRCSSILIQKREYIVSLPTQYPPPALGNERRLGGSQVKKTGLYCTVYPQKYEIQFASFRRPLVNVSNISCAFGIPATFPTVSLSPFYPAFLSSGWRRHDLDKRLVYRQRQVKDIAEQVETNVTREVVHEMEIPREMRVKEKCNGMWDLWKWSHDPLLECVVLPDRRHILIARTHHSLPLYHKL